MRRARVVRAVSGIQGMVYNAPWAVIAELVKIARSYIGVHVTRPRIQDPFRTILGSLGGKFCVNYIRYLKC